MPQRILTIVLLVGLTAVGASIGSRRLPDNQQGYSPKQPIAYSHRLHAGELGIDCRFCHSPAEQGRHAGIPSADVCMKCHKYVTSSFDLLQQEITRADEEKRKPEVIVSPDLRKLYEAAPELMILKSPLPILMLHPFPGSVSITSPTTLRLTTVPMSPPEYLAKSVMGPWIQCSESRQFETLSMGWCVNCHRESSEQGINGHAVKASTDCTVCHN